MREIVKAASELVPFRVDVTPRLERPPVVKERRLRLRRPDRGRREPLFDDLGRTPRPPRVIPPRLPYNIWSVPSSRYFILLSLELWNTNL